MESFRKHREIPAEKDIPSMESIEPASLLEANLRAGITDETHLQSLGFIMDNGRPRFKIDEPVSSSAGLNSIKSGLTTLKSTPLTTELEEESFVVLGKDSLSSIRASSLASFAEIQQKSNSTDYNSIVSSLTAEETEKKLKDLLQENVKLKETLGQNNLAMKRQFNTLAAWQEEIMKVHQSHKQKFSETKVLINQLRKENAELKLKASQESPPVGASDHSLKVKELEAELEKCTLIQKTVQSAREIELEKVNSKLTKELTESKMACKLLTSDVQRRTVLSTRLSQQLKQADLTIEGLKLDVERLELNLKEKEELASFADYSLLSISSKQVQESEIWKKKSSQQESEIKHLRELTTSLEQQLKAAAQNYFPSIEIQTGDNCSRLPSEDRLQFMRNVKQYNDILQKLAECYTKQGSSYVNIQECLRESIEIIQDLEKNKQNADADVSRKEKQDKLASFRVKLNDERLQMISERQELIKAQNQFQKVFSDYNSVLYELEIMQEENAKLSCLQNKNIEESIQQKTPDVSIEMKESLAKERKSLEDAKVSILQIESDVVEERKAKEALQSECERLRTSLDQQKLLQEAEKKSFLAEKKSLEETIRDLKPKNQNLEQTLKSNFEQIDRLKAEIKSLKAEVEKLPFLEAQVQVYEADFKEERQARQQLAEEKTKFLDEHKKLQKLHMELVASLTGQQQSGTQQYSQQQQQQQQMQQQWQQTSASAPPRSDVDSEDVSTPVITAFSCPKCSLSFTALRPLETHVEVCLQLD